MKLHDCIWAEQTIVKFNKLKSNNSISEVNYIPFYIYALLILKLFREIRTFKVYEIKTKYHNITWNIHAKLCYAGDKIYTLIHSKCCFQHFPCSRMYTSHTLICSNPYNETLMHQTKVTNGNASNYRGMKLSMLTVKSQVHTLHTLLTTP